MKRYSTFSEFTVISDEGYLNCNNSGVMLAKKTYRYDVDSRTLCIHEPRGILHYRVGLHSWTHGDQKRENYFVPSAWHILPHTITLHPQKWSVWIATVFRSSSSMPYIIRTETKRGFITNSNITSFFRFVNKRASYSFGIISLAHAPLNVTDFSIGSINFVRHFAQT